MQDSCTYKRRRDGDVIKTIAVDRLTGRGRLVQAVHVRQTNIFDVLDGPAADRSALTDDLASKSDAEA